MQDPDKLNIKVEEDWQWLYKDLELLLDNDHTADLCLNDVANWLKIHGYELIE